MKRSVFLSASAAGLLAAAPLYARAASSDIVQHTPTGDIAGTLTLPDAGAAWTVVLIVPGSGAVDRNGNTGPLQPNTYALLAAALAQRGYASVRYDKRGVAASAGATPSERDLRFETYIGDVAGWIRQLRADRRFSKIVVAGHSEGSLLGMIAVQQAPADRFVSLEGAGRPAATVLREQLKPKIAPELYTKYDAAITQLQQGKTVDGFADSDPLFRPSVQPYLISWFKYDPAVEIAKVSISTTIVQGTADVQVSMVDAQALAHAAPHAKLDVIDGMNHALKHAPDTSSQDAIMKGYTDSSLPVEPRAIDAIVG